MYHVHLTDAATSAVSAAILYAHLTLRGGHLASRIVVSASAIGERNDGKSGHSGTGGQTSEGSGIHSGGGLVTAAAAADLAEGRADVLELLTAAAILQGASAADANGAAGESDGAPESAASSVLGPEVVEQLRPYPYFDKSFADAEQSLVHALSSHSTKPSVGYFDLIVAADLAAYDAVLDYYNSSRCFHLRTGHAPRHESGSAPAHVAIIHVASQDVARAGALVQRFLATILPQVGGEGSGASPDGGEARAMRHERREGEGSSLLTQLARDAWMDAIDGAVASFSQLLGVDVLVTVL